MKGFKQTSAWRCAASGRWGGAPSLGLLAGLRWLLPLQGTHPPGHRGKQGSSAHPSARVSLHPGPGLWEAWPATCASRRRSVLGRCAGFGGCAVCWGRGGEGLQITPPFRGRAPAGLGDSPGRGLRPGKHTERKLSCRSPLLSKRMLKCRIKWRGGAFRRPVATSFCRH